MIETATGTRPAAVVRRFMRGTGMVTPREPVRHGLETLRPGKDRLAPDHEAVLRQLEKFEPRDRADKVTAERMRSLTRSRAGGRAKLDRSTAANNYGLGPPRTAVASWRL